MCGTENRDGLKFCSACGNTLMDTVPNSTAPDISKRTMVGIQSSEVGQAPSSAAKQIPMVKISGSPSSPSGLEGASGLPANTVIGMAAVKPPSPQSGPAKVPIATPVESRQFVTDSRSAENERNSTMLGMRAPSISRTEDSKKTPIEIPTSAVQAAAAAIHAQRAARRRETASRSEDSGATERSPAVNAPREESGRKKKPSPISPASSGEIDSEDFDGLKEAPQRGPGMTIAVAVASAVALLAIGVVIYLTLFDKSSVLRPTLISNADAKSVTALLSFPEAPPGTVIQSAGLMVPLVGGQARIDISMSRLKLGTNDIALNYIEPGVSPKQMSFPLVLRHSVTDDFSGLAAEDPFFTVVFQSAQGVRIRVDGKPAQGLGNAFFHKVRLSDIPESATPDGDVRIYKLPFQLIDETGVVEPGIHTAEIPVSRLRLDRPAASASVVGDSIVCSGSTEDGAKVTVNNTPVSVAKGAFNTVLPLNSIGDHTVTVVARAPGKAPRTVSLKVTRIESFAPAVAEWSTDLDPSLDYPTIGGDPNAQVGKKLKLTGRIVNISTERGVTAFILYVGKGCPPHSKCAVYVVFRGETDAGLQSLVDVLGTVRGVRIVEMQNGVKIEVPAVDAAFVFKTESNPAGIESTSKFPLKKSDS
jgi:hypothetical protein